MPIPCMLLAGQDAKGRSVLDDLGGQIPRTDWTGSGTPARVQCHPWPWPLARLACTVPLTSSSSLAGRGVAATDVRSPLQVRVGRGRRRLEQIEEACGQDRQTWTVRVRSPNTAAALPCGEYAASFCGHNCARLYLDTLPVVPPSHKKKYLSFHLSPIPSPPSFFPKAPAFILAICFTR